MEELYFDSYAHAEVHARMIKDNVRTIAYKRAICENHHLFKGKTVLDVGCGTGILSLFAARAGAKKVYAVDNSDLVETTREIVAASEYASVVDVFRGKIEHVELPTKVDIIVSEWMGICLFKEQMLGSVLRARDKWLRPGGLMFPDKAVLQVFGIDSEAIRKDKEFWESVHGFNMQAMTKRMTDQAYWMTLPTPLIATNPCKVLEIDLQKLSLGEHQQGYSGLFSLGPLGNRFVNALGTFFEVFFTHGHVPVVLSTSPTEPATHWKQTVFMLPEQVRVLAGTPVTGVLHMAPTNQGRGVQVDFECQGQKCRVRVGS